ncbi:hypothetical protein CHS0354_040065 [Potamilus streckersoni]|uniref:Coiled-coil domain-containing protein 169 n=1 Tax=Potamilus streckersoni TaxID=2493646 RepID=A0AAE0W2B1_9BIVA|nr:hypothetical protein CHS0354_040065 [Potamilus streckersoni]
MATEEDDFELEKLRAEIQQEKQMKEMLEQSAVELRVTVEELEKRFESIDNEGNEWKTRFETQEEMNQQLEKQIITLQDKVEDAKRNLKDAKAYVEGSRVSPVNSPPDSPKSKSTGITINISVSPQAGKTPREIKTFDDLSDANPTMIKSLEKEKNQLFNQLRDLEWRLDQESKAYHKANDERKQYLLEINSTKNNLDDVRTRHRAAVTLQQREIESIPRTPRDVGGNIPEDQRIIDPKKGPIKKTAGVRNLPSLEQI